MLSRFEIVEAKAHHCGMMARILRHDHQMAIMRLHADAHRELRRAFDQSSFRRAWLIDGKLAALGGVAGTVASSEGTIWLAVSQAAMKHPRAMFVEAKRQLAGLMATRRSLSTHLVAGDDDAAKFALALGFAARHSEACLGGGVWRWKALRRLDENAESRIPMGRSYMIPLEYRETEV